MKKILIPAAVISAAVLGYAVGIDHSHEEHEHSESALVKTRDVNQYQSGYTKQLTSSNRTLSASNKDTKLDSAVAKVQGQPTNKMPDYADSDAQTLGELISTNPHYFNGLYSEIAKDDAKYPNAIERFSKENGVSEWGLSRERDVNKLLQTENLKSLQVNEVECRIRTCLVRGIAESHEEARKIFEDYQNVQPWGIHFGGREDKYGQYVFYLASFQQPTEGNDYEK